MITPTSLFVHQLDPRLFAMNPLAYISDEQIATLSASVRRAGLEMSARAIEARTPTFGDGCNLDGTVELLRIMVTNHVGEVWYDDCATALHELTLALKEHVGS